MSSGDQGEQATCTPDPQALAEARSCQTDDDCPCKSSCDLGECVTECTVDADCADALRCDDFGRCIDPSAPPSINREEGQLSVDAPNITVGEDAPYPLVLRADSRTERVRIVGRRGAQVRCPDRNAFREACRIDTMQMEPGDQLVVEVRRVSEPDTPLEELEVAEVLVYSPQLTESISVFVPGQRAVGTDNTPSTEELQGFYSGEATLIAAGSSTEESDSMQAPAIPVKLDIEASIWERAGETTIVRLKDPFDVFSTEDAFIGELLGLSTDASGQLDFPDTPFMQANVAGRDSALLARTVEATWQRVDLTNSLVLEIQQRYIGAGGERAPTVRWRVELVRQGDTTDPPPGPRANATLDYDPDTLLLETTPWEEAFTTLASRVPARSISGRDYTQYIESVWRGDRLFGIGAYIPGRDFEDEARYLTSVLTMPNISANDTQPLTEFERGWEGIFDPTFQTVETAQMAPAPNTLAQFMPLTCEFFNIRLFYDEQIQGKFPINIDIPSVNFCQEMSERLGCEVAYRFSATESYTRAATTISEQGMVTETGFLSYRASGEGTCLLPEVLSTTAEFILCMDPPEADSFEDYLDVGFGDELLPQTQDLGCRSAAVSGAALPIDLDMSTTGRQMLRACLDEMEALDQTPVIPSPAQGSGMAEAFAPGTCAQLSRTLAALSLQSRNYRLSQDQIAQGRSVQGYPVALTNRTLTRWLDLHGYFATQGEQVSGVNQALSQFAMPGEIPQTSELYTATLRGWDLVAAPHVLHTILSVPSASLLEVDYRTIRRNIAVNESDEQRIPLAASILDTLTRQTELVRRLMRDSGGADPEVQLERVERLMPRLLLAQTLATDLHLRASSATDTLEWDEDYSSNSSSATGSVYGMFELVSKLQSGENLLGITDNDLPLYFDVDSEGAGARFGAITSFLVGDSLESSAWAPAAVRRAQQSLEDARQPFIDEYDRQLRRAHNDRTFDKWISDARREYNNRLRDYCGPITGSPVDNPTFDAKTCAISDDPGCQLTPQQWYSAWRQPDVLGRACLHENLAQIPGEYGFGNAQVASFVETCIGDVAMAGQLDLVPCGGDGVCLRCNSFLGRDLEDLPLEVGSLNMRLPMSLTDQERAQPGTWSNLLETCQRRHPEMRMFISPPASPFDTPGCVSGTIGGIYLDLAAAATDLRIAQQSAAEFQEAYDIALRSCWLQKNTNLNVQEARSAHVNTMKTLREAKYQADRSASIARGVKDCANSISNVEVGISAAIGAPAAAAACAAGIAEQVYEVKSLDLGRQIENAQTQHDDAVATLVENGDLRRCYQDAKQELVGEHTAMIEIERAILELGRARADAAELLLAAQRAHSEGFAYMQRMEGRQLPDPAGDLWANEASTQYVRDFRLAKRASYLAVRAVEYEYQTTLMLRQDVLEAQTPTELRQDVLEQLLTDVNTGGIGGSLPTEFTTVVSLRDDILRLGDQSYLPPSENPQNQTQRLRLLLTSDKYAVYDDNGNYLGQQIPFQLAPLGALGYETNGVAIYAQNDCAERLWSLNASILGEDVYAGSDTSNVRVDVLKRNTFYSQWCSAGAQDDTFQIASVRPNRNLFREPGVGENVGQMQGADRGVESFSRARIQAYFNIDRTSFEEPTYGSGETGELAARGLYGDYALFIPADLISEGGEQGLRLDRVDDILLRLDYVSVAAN